MWDILFYCEPSKYFFYHGTSAFVIKVVSMVKTSQKGYSKIWISWSPHNFDEFSFLTAFEVALISCWLNLLYIWYVMIWWISSSSWSILPKTHMDCLVYQRNHSSSFPCKKICFWENCCCYSFCDPTSSPLMKSRTEVYFNGV